MSEGDFFIDYGPTGPMVQVVANVNIPRSGASNEVGVIAVSPRGRGWVCLSPDDAEDMAEALYQAAAISRRLER